MQSSTTLWVLNIGNDTQVAPRHLAGTPGRLIRQMRHDLWPLVLWLHEPGEEALYWRFHLSGSGEAVRCSSPYSVPTVTVGGSLSHVELWGPEPSLERLWPNITIAQTGDIARIQLFAKRTAHFPLLTASSLDKSLLPRAIHTRSELRAWLQDSSGTALVLKLPYSSSGRGIFFLTAEDIATRKDLDHLLAQGVVVEPLFDRESDWGMEYCIEGDGKVTFLGVVPFETDHFRYLHSYVAPQACLQAALIDKVGATAVEQLIALHRRFLAEQLAPYYHGRVGIDTLVYRHGGELKLHPAIEINTRTTMGHVALALASHMGQTFEPQRLELRRLQAVEIPLLTSAKRLHAAQGLWEQGTVPGSTTLLTPYQAGTQFAAMLVPQSP